MTIKKLLISLFLLVTIANAQNFGGVYKIDPLLARLKNPDTTYVVNFWATWCKPCVEELPGFDSLVVLNAGTKTKVLLVSLDFKEELDKKIKPFLVKHSIKSECVVLDEINGNDFIDKISPNWSGAIPATLFKKGSNQVFAEKKLKLGQLQSYLADLNKK